MPGTFSSPPRVSDPDMHHGTWVMQVPWCMPGSLTGGFVWSRWREKRSQHSRRMRKPQFSVSGLTYLSACTWARNNDYIKHKVTLYHQGIRKFNLNITEVQTNPSSFGHSWCLNIFTVLSSVNKLLVCARTSLKIDDISNLLIKKYNMIMFTQFYRHWT